MKKFKLLDKYLESHGFIRRSKVQDLLMNAKNAEREEVKKEYEKKIEQVETDLKEKHFLEVTDKEVQIKRLNQRLADADERLKDARKAYHNYKNDVKGVNRLISDIIFHIKRLFDK